jgi:hypothetical protein
MKVAGQWRYENRAIDQFGQVIDVFYPTPRPDRATGVRSAGAADTPRTGAAQAKPARQTRPPTGAPT